jgi:serine/threonine-protein kinase PknK
VLADDDVLLREGLARLLGRSGFEVVRQAGNGVELLVLARSARPELAVIDIRMPPAHGTEGLQAARVIRAELPGTAIIVLSAHVEKAAGTGAVIFSARNCSGQGVRSSACNWRDEPPEIDMA